MIFSPIVHDVANSFCTCEYIISVELHAHSPPALRSFLPSHSDTHCAHFHGITSRTQGIAFIYDTKCQGRINFMWMLVIINLNEFGHFQNAKSLISEISVLSFCFKCICDVFAMCSCRTLCCVCVRVCSMCTHLRCECRVPVRLYHLPGIMRRNNHSNCNKSSLPKHDSNFQIERCAMSPECGIVLRLTSDIVCFTSSVTTSATHTQFRYMIRLLHTRVPLTRLASRTEQIMGLCERDRKREEWWSNAETLD